MLTGLRVSGAGFDRETSASLEGVTNAYLLSERPSWRGRIHSWAFFAAIPAGILLILVSNGVVGHVSASIYAATLVLLFGTSAAYHRLAHSPRARAIMQRLDHSMIYLLIAGTYVPLCLVALPPAWGIPTLAVVGTLAVFGMVLKLTAFNRARWLAYALYPIMGWVALVAAPALVQHLSTFQLLLIVGGGIAYTVGIPVLVKRRPDPWPKTFGYHEIWHVITVVAAAMHFTAVSNVLA